MRFAKFFVAFAAMVVLCMPMALAAEAPVLSVDGRGSAAITPDQAVITVGVTTHARNANQAQAENAQKSAAITQALQRMGVAANDIKSQNFSFAPDYHMDEKRRNEISGYTANHSLQVNVRDVAKIGKIIDAALNAGANEVTSLRFSVSNQNKVRQEALEQAIADARNKADIIARGLGRQIVGIKSVSESTGYIEARSYSGNMMMAAKAADTNIEPGTISLDASVHIDFLLSDH
ncbi:hypothetical protein SAMN05216582_11121 [Selenomonas ruminantium]|uniref:SIMPL domain-containing protein n=1 Tax=Selenomonas ruminantium TaxID=971 RepID=A0A1M6U7P1_SELRU|nr:SIMPL domain-containing protein [Selenomonas ruminantium]SHK65272.1 hypothetical protein SAMN05216582_11121 [Selenomonas ruminantium]